MTARSVFGSLPVRIVSVGALVVALSIGAIAATTSVPAVDAAVPSGPGLTLLYFVLWVGVIGGTMIVLLPGESGRRGASGRR